LDIVFFVHPNFLDSQSMPRFATMLINGMKKRGHHVEVLSPKPFFFGLLRKSRWNKWLGYIDQYIIFPRQVNKLLDNKSKNKLYVFSDQALGPWVPMVASYPHIIHCHDFLALRSALGEFPENKSGWTGKQYQAFIRRGFNKGKNFISVSNNTKNELHRFLTSPYSLSTVVYNGLNQSFGPGNVEESRNLLGKQMGINLTDGYLLHVGGNQWYKNRKGVIEIYESWCSLNKNTLPLLMIGKKPGKGEPQYFFSRHFLKASAGPLQKQWLRVAR